jgi:hypothetical protein
MKKFVYVIEVEGRGDFPIDMLRYDQCAPVFPSDASRIIADASQDVRGRRTVRLNCYSNSPTPARWSSFGWAMKEIGKEKL